MEEGTLPMSQPQFIILQGQGINCENETLFALEKAGGQGKKIPLLLLQKNPSLLKDAQGLILPGGFSFGDDLGSGLILAESIRHFLKEELQNFIEKKKPILGICNGFQAMMKMNLLPNPESILKDSPEEVKMRAGSLIANESGEFQNRWVSLQVSEKSTSPWWSHLRGQEIFWPIRHGEGRLVMKDLNFQENDPQICLRYVKNENGSQYHVAGLQSADGLVVGMMPHPEAALKMNQDPRNVKKGDETFASGYYFFKGIVDYFNNK